MALTSPGVEVTIIDQSQYLPAPTNSVPLILLATAQNKANASNTGVAVGTTAANANKLFQVTSQRDLVNLYGTPFFYTTTNGTPIQGYELNEYGLLAAYSTLGVTNRCYVLRADIDLASLVGQTGRPVGSPANGTYWLNTTDSTWGIYVFNLTTGKFTLQTPIVITDSTDVDGSGVPLSSIGSIGDYAINTIEYTGTPYGTNSTYFYKTTNNVWVSVGGGQWKLDIPTTIGTASNPSLTAGDQFTINVSGAYSFVIQVPTAPNNTVAGVAAAINTASGTQVTAKVINGKLNVYSNQQVGTGSINKYIKFTNTTNTPLASLGITANTNFYQPLTDWGTSAQMPLWTSSQLYPRPTGSVWIKVGSAGTGLNPSVAVYNAATQSWLYKNVTLNTSDWEATSSLDASGGKAILANTIYGQYDFDNELTNSPLYLWKRIATGATVVTGSVVDPVFIGTNYINVYISEPGNDMLTGPYLVTVPAGDATDFVTAWYAAGIPYTTCVVTTDGSIQITHTEGGEIVMDDTVNSLGVSTYVSNGLLTTAGFVYNSTDGCKTGPFVLADFNAVAVTGGSGTSATLNINAIVTYTITGIAAAGTGYLVGNTITVPYTSLGGTSSSNTLTLKVRSVNGSGGITSVSYVSGLPKILYQTQLSNWREFTYISNEGEPSVAPINDTNWFYSVVDQVDIMVNKGGAWLGYQNTGYDYTGAPSATGSNMTDANGPIIAATAPMTQSTGDALAYGDLWIDTSDLEMYPVINRWESIDGTDQWVLLNNTDQTSSTGVLFADARWATNGDVSPSDDPIPSITSLLTSDYLDLDAPSASLYPQGMLLFNTRRSGYNVKQFKVNYFNNTSFPGATLPTQTNAWVTVSGNQTNGSPYMGRQAQRAMVVQALNASIATNTAIRDEDNFFNLLATPNYPELQPGMITLNNDRGQTGYILGDTPMRLPDDATAIQAWANNEALAGSTGEEGLVTRDTYMGLFYPSGLATDLQGNQVAVPSSYMMLRTFLRNDTISYPWLAAAGTRRGTIDNALSIGYVDATTGEFMPIKTRLGIRDVLYINFINPLVFFTGVGLLNYGNKTSFNSSSALDRTNVARLIAYIRRQLTLAARPFVFEPNDALTRNQIAGVVETLMVDLVAKRGLYDYLVVCDESNNTPARIDRNELWIDVAVEPVKAAEFIYIPVRILNTGELGGQ
jgi:hypothetical protein